MNNYDVIIIGAGPGGIFGAYELIEKNPDCKIAVFEAGHELAKRKCPIERKENKELYFLQELFYYEWFWRGRCFFGRKIQYHK